MTVAELITKLQTFPSNLAVLVTWEGQVIEIDESKINLIDGRKEFLIDSYMGKKYQTKVVLIDAEDN